MSQTDQIYMARALEIAKNSRRFSSPNPCVGTVIVYQDKIIAEGYTSGFGGAHGEINALKKIKDLSILSESTLYVTLEPCAHQGKTPSCAKKIAELKPKKVVIGTLDPFEKVNGEGLKILQNAGIQTTIGVLEKQCLEMHKKFIIPILKQRPFITLKWAQTLDGFIDKKREQNSISQINWITNAKTQVFSHFLRSEHKAILVGKNTILNDNPSLTTRSFPGNNPLIILLDTNLECPLQANIFSSGCWVINAKRQGTSGNIRYFKVPREKETLSFLMQILQENNIQSLLVEGGATTLNYFIEKNLWDEMFVFVGNTNFHNGLGAPKIQESKRKLIGNFNYQGDQIFQYLAR